MDVASFEQRVQLEGKHWGLIEEGSVQAFLSEETDPLTSAKGIFYAVLCSIDGTNRINKLINRAGSVFGFSPDKLEVIVEKKTRTGPVLLYGNQPLHNTFKELRDHSVSR